MVFEWVLHGFEWVLNDFEWVLHGFEWVLNGFEWCFEWILLRQYSVLLCTLLLPCTVYLAIFRLRALQF